MTLATIFVGALFASMASAQEHFEFWPDADYDPAVPTVESVLGHAARDPIAWHADAMRYFEALADIYCVAAA